MKATQIVEVCNDQNISINRFCPVHKDKTDIFVYFKHRNPMELKHLQSFLNVKNINYTFFSYDSRYKEIDYLNTLQKAKYGIILDAHESQGFAIEEALSCNVPLLVWNVKYLNQEYRSGYPQESATSIEYWDDRCGEVFYDAQELEKTFNIFLSKLDTYQPRKYVMENLSVEKCAKNFYDLVNCIGNKNSDP